MVALLILLLSCRTTSWYQPPRTPPGRSGPLMKTIITSCTRPLNLGARAWLVAFSPDSEGRYLLACYNYAVGPYDELIIMSGSFVNPHRYGKTESEDK